MVTKIHRDALQSEIASLRVILERSEGRDALGALSLRQRLSSLEVEFSKLDEQKNNYANVALIFDGEPVQGSSAIDADFAGKALQDYQELITKHVAAENGQLTERGRLANQIHNQAKMNITALMHGSFGFVLEENTIGQISMFETPAQRAVYAVTDLLNDVSSDDENLFESKLDELDIRIFQTLKRFVNNLHRNKSTLRIAEERRELKIDYDSVERAFERVSQVDFDESDETLEGELLGLIPIQRRFEFRRGDNGDLLQGRVAANLSADYLERIEKEGLLAGAGWRAMIRTKTIHHPDGRHRKVSHILIDLVRA